MFFALVLSLLATLNAPLCLDVFLGSLCVLQCHTHIKFSQLVYLCSLVSIVFDFQVSLFYSLYSIPAVVVRCALISGLHLFFLDLYKLFLVQKILVNKSIFQLNIVISF